MATSITSGLGASFGYAAEGTVGTRTAPSRWTRFDKESLALVKTAVTSVGLHQGLYQEAKRRNFVAKDAKGQVSLDLQTAQLGVWFKHMLGLNTTGTNGTAVQQAASSAYKQNHAPGDQLSLGMTVEVGRPQINGTIQSFTYTGCKVMDWQISCARNQLAKLDLTLDSWNEDTSQTYTAPTLTNYNVFDFSQGSVLLGGTPTTTSGVTSIASGAAPGGVVSSVIVKGTNPLKVDRFTLGSQTKKEQLADGFRAVDVEIICEFSTLADFYTSLFATDTSTPVEIKFTGASIPSGGGNNFYVDIVLPAVFWDTVPIIVPGPNVIEVTVKGVALDNGTDNVVQLQYMSTDTTI